MSNTSNSEEAIIFLNRAILSVQKATQNPLANRSFYSGCRDVLTQKLTSMSVHEAEKFFDQYSMAVEAAFPSGEKPESLTEYISRFPNTDCRRSWCLEQ